MTTFAVIDSDALATVTFVQSADPTNLTTRANAVLAALAVNPQNRITAINLAGAGDGHTFVVEIISALAANIVGAGLDPALISVRCYMAADASQLLLQRSRVPLTGSPLGDELVAGASQGTRFMGLFVLGAGSSPDADGGMLPPVETILLASPTRLVDIDTAALANGTTVKVLSVEDVFELITNPTAELVAATDGITVVQPTVNPGHRWVRWELGSIRWRTQVAWFVDPVNGNDENVGSLALPIQTMREFSRRMGPTGEIQATIDVTLTSDTQATDTLCLRDLLVRPDAIIRILGTPVVVDSGTITAKTDLNSATQTPPNITDAAQDFGAYVTKRLRITTPGPRLNAIAWVAKILNPGPNSQVRTSAWGINNTLAVPFGEGVTLVNPQVGDAYVVEDLPILSAVSLAITKVVRGAQSFDGCLFADLKLGRSAVLNDRLYFGDDANIALSGCNIFARNIYGRQVSATNCLQQPTVFQMGQYTWYAGLHNGAARPLQPCVINVAQQCASSLPGAFGFFADGGSQMFISDAMAFDCGNGLTVSTDSQVYLLGLLWGNNNTNFGIFAAGRVHYDAAVKPTVTGLVDDTRIGGVNTPYAAVPFYNGNNGAMIAVTPI